MVSPILVWLHNFIPFFKPPKKPPWNFDFTKIIQKAQKNVAAQDKNVFIIHTDKLNTFPDNTRFNTEAQIWLGEKMGNIMVRVTN